MQIHAHQCKKFLLISILICVTELEDDATGSWMCFFDVQIFVNDVIVLQLRRVNNAFRFVTTLNTHLWSDLDWKISFDNTVTAIRIILSL